MEVIKLDRSSLYQHFASSRQAANCEAINSFNGGAVSLIRLHKTDNCRVRYQIPSVISGFRREVDENCALLGYYTANSGNFLSTFRGKILVPSSAGFLRGGGFLNLENGTDKLSRNVGKKLPLLAA